MITEDYFQFTMLKFSRPLNEAVIQRIVDSVRSGTKEERKARRDEIAEQLKQNPILVTSKFEVIEGKHKLEIARRLELPVAYTIKET